MLLPGALQQGKSGYALQIYNNFILKQNFLVILLSEIKKIAKKLSMGKNKLKKFADMAEFKCVYQYPREELLRAGFPHRGKWNGEVFTESRPLIVELGCGKGEYTVGLARHDETHNYVGIDIKGARMWSGAREVEASGMTNAAFLRAEIENIEHFFAPDEVDELWITFPDPQMQKVRKRLTSTRFLNLYRKLLKPDGIVNLKTDSPFLYEYTRRLVKLNGLPLLSDSADIYGLGFGPDDDLYGTEVSDPARSIKTYYEQQWLSRGKQIKLLRFRLPADGELQEPQADDIPKDDYRSTKGRPQMGSLES